MNAATPTLLALLLAACGAREQAVSYGRPLALERSTPVSELFDRSAELEGRHVRVEGMVTEVCAKRGCWFRLAGDRDYESLTFKVADGVIVFPMDMRGKYAVAEGIVRRHAFSLEQTRNYLAQRARERGEPFDPAGVTEPMSIPVLDGLGAVVRDPASP